MTAPDGTPAKPYTLTAAPRCPVGQKCPPDGTERQITRLSWGLVLRLRRLSDELYESGVYEAGDLSAEMDEIIKRGSYGMCTDCGSYEACGCDAMADQQMTGGY